MRLAIYFLLPFLFFSSCIRTGSNAEPYSAKKVKSFMEKKYDQKFEHIETLEIRKSPMAKYKYTYQNTETNAQFWVTAQLSVPNANGFLPFLLDIFGYDKTYSDTYESCLMLQKKEQALILAQKYDVQLVITDTLTTKVHDKIYLKDYNDIVPAAMLIFDLNNLYAFPHKHYSDIEAYVKLYKTIDDTIASEQKDDERHLTEIDYRRISEGCITENPNYAITSMQDLASYIKRSYDRVVY